MSPGMISTTLGLVIGAIGLPALLVPGKAHTFFTRLYRNILAARALTVLDLLWVGLLLIQTFWGGFEPYKRYTFVLVPVAIVLICLFVDDLLMPRALGGLFLLVPAPVLDAFRWEASSCRYVPIVLCYVLIIAGFALIMNPYVYRKSLEFTGRSMPRFRATGGLVVSLGVVLLGLGLWVF